MTGYDIKITLKKIGTMVLIMLLTGAVTILTGNEVPTELLPYTALVPLIYGVLNYLKHKDD